MHRFSLDTIYKCMILKVQKACETRIIKYNLFTWNIQAKYVCLNKGKLCVEMKIWHARKNIIFSYIRIVLDYYINIYVPTQHKKKGFYFSTPTFLCVLLDFFCSVIIDRADHYPKKQEEKTNSLQVGITWRKKWVIFI